MGSDPIKNPDPIKVSVARALKKDYGLSESDVTLGLDKSEESINNFIESVYPEDCTESVKNEIKKKLKVILHSKAKKNIKDKGEINSIAATIGGKYNFFIFVFDSNKDGTINIAYKLISGEIDIEKAHTYELVGDKKYNEKVEDIAPEETKNIIRNYLGLKDDEKLNELLQEEKKNLLADE